MVEQPVRQGERARNVPLDERAKGCTVARADLGDQLAFLFLTGQSG
jgi:hypothetical protein